VALLDPDGPAVLWWAGEAAPDAEQAATVIALAEAAAGLVLLTGSGDELGDIILTSRDTFQVVRLVDDDTVRVAHLTLNRAAANLAMARRDFRTLIEGYTRQPRHRAVLPRRSRADPPSVTEEAAVEMPPDLFALLREPYTTDDGALDRILVTLRRL
jgi:hypothetical protein